MERLGLKTTGSEKGRAVAENKIRKSSGSTDRRQFLTSEETINNPFSLPSNTAI
jgi:hypothetical protein